jgi:hypothetical protein
VAGVVAGEGAFLAWVVQVDQDQEVQVDQDQDQEVQVVQVDQDQDQEVLVDQEVLEEDQVVQVDQDQDQEDQVVQVDQDQVQEVLVDQVQEVLAVVPLPLAHKLFLDQCPFSMGIIGLMTAFLIFTGLEWTPHFSSSSLLSY